MKKSSKSCVCVVELQLATAPQKRSDGRDKADAAEIGIAVIVDQRPASSCKQTLFEVKPTDPLPAIAKCRTNRALPREMCLKTRRT